MTLAHGATLAQTLTLPRIFCDHMVLQQGKPVPIWGAADASQQVVVAFGAQKKTATADATGNWRVMLDPMPDSAEPRELSVQSRHADPPIIIKDVLVGEVWLCSGQSNMRYIMGKRDKFPGVEHGEEEIAKPERPGIRIFSDDGEEVWDNRGWQRCGGEALARFSATAFFFGNALHRELQAPVGLVNVSRGGAPLKLRGGVWNDVELAGADGVYHAARATIKGNQAIIASDEATAPKALRYGWRPVFTPSLFNEAGLPAAPFALVVGDNGKVRPGLVASVPASSKSNR